MQNEEVNGDVLSSSVENRGMWAIR